MTADELTARSAAAAQQSDIRDQLQRVLKAAWAQGVTADDPLFSAERERLWAEEHAATRRLDHLEGVPARLSDLRWRVYRTGVDTVGTLDPAVPLTAAERAELDRLEATVVDERQALTQQTREIIARHEPDRRED